MTPPKSREQPADVAVLSSQVKDLERRVGDLEHEDDEREKSHEGIRSRFDAHLVEDAKAFAEIKASQKLLIWLFGLLFVVAAGGSGWILVKLYDLAPARTERPL